jgi:hypothetical protein
LWHPAALYETLSASSGILQPFIDLKDKDFAQVSFSLRLIFSLFQYLFWALLVGALVWMETKSTTFRFTPFDKFLLLLFSAAPLAIHTSYLLQVDNSVGVLFFSPFAIFLLAAGLDALYGGLLFVAAFGAGMLAGLGKNEWSIVFVVSCVFVLIYAGWMQHVNRAETKQTDRFMKVAAISMCGCLAGNLANYLVDDFNYLEGFRLIGRFVQNGQGSLFGRGWELLTWLKLTLGRSSYLLVSVVALSASGIYWLTNFCKANLWILWCILLTSGLFLPFSFAARPIDMRYLSPTLALSVVLVILLIHEWDWIKTNWRYTIPVFAVMALVFVLHYSIQLRELNWARQNYEQTPSYIYLQDQLHQEQETGCIPVLDTAVGFYADHQDYLGSSATDLENEQIAAQHNKKICLQP